MGANYYIYDDIKSFLGNDHKKGTKTCTNHITKLQAKSQTSIIIALPCIITYRQGTLTANQCNVKSMIRPITFLSCDKHTSTMSSNLTQTFLWPSLINRRRVCLLLALMAKKISAFWFRFSSISKHEMWVYSNGKRKFDFLLRLVVTKPFGATKCWILCGKTRYRRRYVWDVNTHFNWFLILLCFFFSLLSLTHPLIDPSYSMKNETNDFHFGFMINHFALLLLVNEGTFQVLFKCT